MNRMLLRSSELQSLQHRLRANISLFGFRSIILLCTMTLIYLTNLNEFGFAWAQPNQYTNDRFPRPEDCVGDPRSASSIEKAFADTTDGRMPQITPSSTVPLPSDESIRIHEVLETFNYFLACLNAGNRALLASIYADKTLLYYLSNRYDNRWLTLQTEVSNDPFLTLLAEQLAAGADADEIVQWLFETPRPRQEENWFGIRDYYVRGFSGDAALAYFLIVGGDAGAENAYVVAPNFTWSNGRYRIANAGFILTTLQEAENYIESQRPKPSSPIPEQ